jgi:hypothetical protein
MNFASDKIASIRPTKLYIKKCSHCDLKYFGKTITEDIEKYPGSGKRWINHIKKHNAKSIHIWNSDWYYDASITDVARKFCKDNHIVESSLWANLIEENGIDGANREKRSSESIAKQTKTVNDPIWKETVGKESHRKRLITIGKPEWKETVGKKGYDSASKKTSGKARPWISDLQKERHEKIRTGKILNPNSKRWEVTDPEGNVFIVDNLPLFCNEHKISQGSLSSPRGTKGYSAVCLGYVRDFLEVTDICN